MGTPALPATETTRQAHDLSHHKSIRMLRYKDCSNIKEAATPKPSTLSDCSRTEAATCYVEIENQASVSG
jgi:hypothetical protein